MKKIIATILLSALLLTTTSLICTAEDVKIYGDCLFNIDADNVVRINLSCRPGNGFPWVADESYVDSGHPMEVGESPVHRHYAYDTDNRNEIAYILHYLNSMQLIDDGKKRYGADGIETRVGVYMEDGSAQILLFAYGRFHEAGGKQYDIDNNEFGCIIDFIHAMKTKKIVPEDTLTLEPSEWAAADIDSAIASGLLPRRFRINYVGDITRLEFCRLVENYLTVKNIPLRKDANVKHTFKDIYDTGVTVLWSNGIINGKSETQFCPYDFITREELATILKRMSDTAGNGEDGAAESVLFNDRNSISDWATDGVSFASSCGILIGDADKNFRPKDRLTTQETIVILVRLGK